MTPMTSADMQLHYQAFMADLTHAYAAGDTAGFDAALDRALGLRESAVLVGVSRASQSLLAALTHFRSDSRIVALAAREIPDARLRLDHVLQMTEEAAHRTLDLIERTVPLAEATARNAKKLSDTLDECSHSTIRQFLADVCTNAAGVRANLTEVMLAQGFQDLSGQILHGVRKLIGEVETVLDELSSITGHTREERSSRGGLDLEGPAVPGVTHNAVAGQSDVDDLMAGLGI
jgi:chemotaxis protein CheZ